MEHAVQTLKEGLKWMTRDSLSTRLPRFLFRYRLTPQNTTARTPAEILMRDRLDFLCLNTKAMVVDKQKKQRWGIIYMQEGDNWAQVLTSILGNLATTHWAVAARRGPYIEWSCLLHYVVGRWVQDLKTSGPCVSSSCRVEIVPSWQRSVSWRRGTPRSGTWGTCGGWTARDNRPVASGGYISGPS